MRGDVPLILCLLVFSATGFDGTPFAFLHRSSTRGCEDASATSSLCFLFARLEPSRMRGRFRDFALSVYVFHSSLMFGYAGASQWAGAGLRCGVGPLGSADRNARIALVQL